MPTIKKVRSPKTTTKPRVHKTVVKTPVIASNSVHYDRLFLAVAIFAFVAVGLTIVVFRSNSLYQAQQQAAQLDATPLIFERHQNLSPDCGGDPLVTVPECNTQ